MIQLVRDVGEIKGTQVQVLAALAEIKATLRPVTAAVADHERRLKDLEARAHARVGDRRFFWTGVVLIATTLAATAIGAARGLFAR